MYTKSELERLKYNELKNLAKKKNISRRWTCKREIIDQLISSGEDDNLDMITLTLVESPDSNTDSSKSQFVGEDVSVPQQSAPEAVGRTRSARSRFPKPRMTVFQQDGDSPVPKQESSLKGNQKYFSTPGRLRQSKANESFNCSSLSNASGVDSTRTKKLLTNDLASIGTTVFSGVTFREQRRPITRSYKNLFPSQDLSESVQEYNTDSNSNEKVGATEHEHNSTSGIRISRRTRLTNTEETNPNCNLDKTFEIQTQTIKSNMGFPLESNIPEEDAPPDVQSYSIEENKSVTSPFRIQINNQTSTPKDSNSNEKVGATEHEHNSTSGIRISRRTRLTNTEETNPNCNLDKTFEIQTQTIESNMGFPLESNIPEEDAPPDVQSYSIEENKSVTSPFRIQINNQTSTPKDYSDDKENESDLGTLNATFEVPCASNTSFHISNVEKPRSGRKKRSISCPYKEKDKEDCSKAVFFSPTAKLVTSFKSPLQPKRGTPLKGTKIPKFVKKMPDFTNIHKKEFEKMESVVDCHQRKLDRAKMFSPKATMAIPKRGQPVMVFTAQPSATKQIPSRNQMTQRNVVHTNQVNKNFARAAGESNALQRPRPYNGQLIKREEIKQMVTQKLPLQKRRMGVREESRTAIRGVRLNRRFELQMAHRNLK